ncbi:MAG: hypothetical protein ACK42D_00615 [Candidatus Paceibacteria bacterium]
MAITLLINPGSSSKKFALVNERRTLLLLRFERDGAGVELCTVQDTEQQKCEGIDAELYSSALAHVLDTAKAKGVINSLSDITKVGVRVVAPGTFFQPHQVIDDVFVSRLKARSASAPLHIPATLNEISQAMAILPEALLVSVSDSAFHSTMPMVARTYSIKREDTDRYDIYRFGYHGLSCASVLRQSKTVIGEKSRVVIAHIGSGVSLTAVKDGQSIDTSMGFSPASGMIMGTRAGDIESGALLELMRVRDMGLFETQQYLQTVSGLKGLAHESDLRHLLERKAKGDFEAIEALDHFTYRFRKVLGSMVAALGGLDALIFTATAVERNPQVRSLLLAGGAGFPITLNNEKNEQLINHDGIISAEDSSAVVALIRTQEFAEMERVVESLSENM